MPQDSSLPTRPNNWVPIRQQYLRQPRPLKIITIGAGFSGLTIAYKIQHQYQFGNQIQHVIYEKNPDIGGTWYENRYPGLVCDIPAHIYVFTWEPNPDWTSFYASGSEILAYMKRTADKYNLTKDIQFNSKVVSAEWDELGGRWHVNIEQNGKITQDVGDLLINAGGCLNNWIWPDINGLKDFQGHLVHSARWDNEYNFQGKKVGIIGNGASGVQILPQIQPIAAHVTTFIRTPTWISPNFVGHFAGVDGKNFSYSEEEKSEFHSNPQKLFALRKKLENDLNKYFSMIFRDSPEQASLRKSVEQLMLKRLRGNKEFASKLTPTWGVGCRRITPGEGYLEALTAENTEVTLSDIFRVTNTGIETVDNKYYDLDAIICATGFDVSYRPRWKLIGRNEMNPEEAWKKKAEGYFGLTAYGFPNYFFFLGPNSPYTHGNLLACIEWSADYILKWIKKIQEEDIHSIEVTKAAVDDFNTYADEFLKQTVWSDDCRSWCKNHTADGKVSMYPGSLLHFKEMLEMLRTEDFTIKYRTVNRFTFMGNGFTNQEITGGDLSYYLEK